MCSITLHVLVGVGCISVASLGCRAPQRPGVGDSAQVTMTGCPSNKDRRSGDSTFDEMRVSAASSWDRTEAPRLGQPGLVGGFGSGCVPRPRNEWLSHSTEVRYYR